MRIAVIGAGAMGLLFGGRLAMAGEDVTMIDVNPIVLKVLCTEGIELQDDAGTHRIPVKACRAQELQTPVELAILFTKTIHSRLALNEAQGFLNEKTAILSLQNGLGNLELIEEFVARTRILIGVTNLPSDFIGPGCIRSHGTGYTKIMSADGRRNTVLEQIAARMRRAGLCSEVTENVMEAIWEKAAFNAAINSTTAVCHLPCGGIGSVEEGKMLAFEIARESAAVAHAEGIEVAQDQVIAALKETFRYHAEHFTSMEQDVRNRRKTEIESINGEIVRRGRRLGVPTPKTEALYLILRTIEQTYNLQVG